MSDSLREQVISNLRACLISSQGGIPEESFIGDYHELLGEPIPFKKLGFTSCLEFLKSVPEIKISNSKGTVIIQANKSASSNHLSALVESQKKSTAKNRKSRNVKRRNVRRECSKPSSSAPQLQRCPTVRENVRSSAKPPPYQVQKAHSAVSVQQREPAAVQKINETKPKQTYQFQAVKESSFSTVRYSRNAGQYHPWTSIPLTSSRQFRGTSSMEATEAFLDLANNILYQQNIAMINFHKFINRMYTS